MTEVLTKIITPIVVAGIIAAFGYLYRYIRRVHRTISQVERQMVQIGEVDLKASPEYLELSKGNQDREASVYISFKPPFTARPKVVVSLQKIDVEDEKKIPRIAVDARRIEPDGFHLCFRTWRDSLVHNAAASWVARIE
jgi:H-type lectin domain